MIDRRHRAAVGIVATCAALAACSSSSGRPVGSTAPTPPTAVATLASGADGGPSEAARRDALLAGLARIPSLAGVHNTDQFVSGAQQLCSAIRIEGPDDSYAYLPGFAVSLFSSGESPILGQDGARIVAVVRSTYCR